MTLARVAAFLLLVVLSVPGVALAKSASEREGIPPHPERLEFKELVYSVPDPADYRETLSNGIPVFLAEDRDLPLLSLSVLIRTGDYVVAPGKEGLASMVGYLLRNGGTERATPEEVDERLEFLAASIRTGVGETRASASLSCLSKDFDEVLGLLVEVLRTPRFDAKKLEDRKVQVLQDLERRNDRTASIESREWAWLMRGDEHFGARFATKATIDGITREDLIAFHRTWYHPASFIITVSGDFDREEMLAKLEKAFAGWPGEAPQAPPIPAPSHEPRPGVYVVNKDVNQGRVSIGHLGIRRDDPDYYAVRVMNEILGGGGFTSRVTSRVRSDEGLAYTARSSYPGGVYYPGVFRAFFQSKTRTCARATAIILEEMERIRTEKVTPDELAIAKNAFIETLPRNFESPAAIVGTFADDLYTGRDHSFWVNYRKSYESVDAKAVLAAAREHLHPDRLVILAVGDAEGLLAGDPEHPDFRFASFGSVTRLALPDPMTLKRPAAPSPGAPSAEVGVEAQE